MIIDDNLQTVLSFVIDLLNEAIGLQVDGVVDNTAWFNTLEAQCSQPLRRIDTLDCQNILKEGGG
ncbi:hypothetical protein [Haliea sp.]